MKRCVIVISGPTAVGKTNFSLQLAKSLSTEIISADSRQLYKELNIGTAKPTQSELQEVNHHFINHLSIKDRFTANHFETQGLAIVKQLHEAGKTPIIVGGTGLYIDALIKGLDYFPDISLDELTSINKMLEGQSINELQATLEEKDPSYYKQVDRMNRRRLERALQVIIHTEKPYSSFLNKTKEKRDFHTIHVILNLERNILYDRINQRVDKMIQQGLEDEVKGLLNYSHLKALDTVGYREFFDYFKGNYHFETCVEKIKTNTRRYAKRQITWLKRYENIAWFDTNKHNEINQYIHQSLNEY